jgi:hypothetical protein
VISVITQFMRNIQEQQDTDSQSDRKTGYTYQ